MEAHPTDDQIEELAVHTFGSAEKPMAGRSGFDTVEEHLKLCEVCRAKFDQYGLFVTRLASSRIVGVKTAGLLCLPDTVWTELAAGIQRGDADAALNHAATCDHCAFLLRQAIADFAEELTPEEESEIIQLSSSKPGWSKEFAAELISHSGPVPKTSPEADLNKPPLSTTTPSAIFVMSMRRPFYKNWIPWAVSAVIVLCSTVILLRHRDESSLAATNQLLAEAYSEQRTLELRFPGAPYAPLRVRRGSSSARLDRPASLLKAESQIASRKTAGSQEVGWLVATSRAELLEGNYDAAIRSLQQAASIKPETQSVNLDLATAYYERASATGNDPDFGIAADTIGQVLENDPNNAIALFNRALIYEHLFFYSKAVEDWNHYLKVDPTGEWAQEAREHLSAVERKIEEKNKTAKVVLFQGSEAIARGKPREVSDDAIDSRAEEYQRVALKKWLPLLGSSVGTSQIGSSSENYQAAVRVSEIFRTRHNDLFLTDLLKLRRVRHSSSLDALASLADAIKANESGDEHRALLNAKKGRNEFLKEGNEAGALRSQFEIIYALQFTSQSKKCIALANALANASYNYGYSWLEAQALIEQGFCANMDGDLRQAAYLLKKAQVVASKSHYEELEERALLGEAALEWEFGSTPLAWDYVLAGLQRYWEHPVSDLRGASFYALLDLIAEDGKQWHLQRAALDESIGLIAHGEDRLPLAQALSRRAGSDLMLRETDSARKNLERAMNLFQSAPQTSATLSQEMTVSINVAKAELQSGDYSRSLQHLESMRGQVTDLHETLSLLDFYSTMGEAYRKSGRFHDAEIANGRAILLFCSASKSITDPRDRLTWSREASGAYRSLIQLKLDQHLPSQALDVWQSYREDLAQAESLSRAEYPHVLASKFEPRYIRRKSSGRAKYLPSTMADNILTLTYVRLPEGLVGWARFGDNIEFAQIGHLEEIERIRVVLFAECSDPSSDLVKLKINSRRLFDLLIEPFAGLFSTSKAVRIEADEDLAKVPFNALVDPGGNFVGLTHDVAISLGATRQSKPQNRPSLNFLDSILLTFSSSTENTNSIRDPLAKSEVSAIASLFRNPIVLDQQEMSKAKFQHLISNVSIFHYAGHSGTSGEGGRLFLRLRGANGQVQTTSIFPVEIGKYSLRKCRLVVLSACQTNEGMDGHSMDRENLALTFINAGVPEVVASSWEVDSNATQIVMNAFYSFLLKGNTAPNALRLATNELRRSAAFVHPYFWAGFSVCQTSPIT